jgi:hypothetical protein
MQSPKRATLLLFTAIAETQELTERQTETERRARTQVTENSSQSPEARERN